MVRTHYQNEPKQASQESGGSKKMRENEKGEAQERSNQKIEEIGREKRKTPREMDRNRRV